MTKVAWLVGALTLLATGSYTFVYLYRWEWHRALLVALVFVAAEVAVATALILRKLAKIDRDGRRRNADPPPDILAELRDGRPARDHFGWLDARAGQLGVFIPILLGGGVIVSMVAWVVERIAGGTAGASLERSLATQLAGLQPPSDGLVASDAELCARSGDLDDDEQVRLMLGLTAERS